MKLITLTKNAVAKIDDEDWARIVQNKWCLCGKYAIRRTGPRPGRVVYMHHEILGRQCIIDHINRDPLDNQKANLRIADKTLNSQNRGLQSNNTSGYKGVSWCQNRWQAYIKINGKKICLGSFLTSERAAEEYNKKASLHFGEYAVLNSF